MRTTIFTKFIVIMLVVMLFSNHVFGREKIGNITKIKGEHKNFIIGVGLLTGLKGTGDPDNIEKIKAELASLKNNGMENISERDITSKNVAIVQVQGNLKPYAKIGQTITLTVASKGSAKSLEGGELMPTLLHSPYLGKDKIYAIAAGAITVDSNNPNTGTVQAVVEAEVPVTYLHKEKKGKGKYFLLDLSTPNFSNANTVANDINLIYGNNEEEDNEDDSTVIATAIDAATIKVNIPAKFNTNPILFISGVQKLIITDYVEEAKIIISQRNESVVVSGSVTMAPVAIAYKDLSVKIGGQAGQAGQENSFIDLQASATLKDLTNSLNRLGVKPKDLVQIMKNLHDLGSLRAKLEIK